MIDDAATERCHVSGAHGEHDIARPGEVGDALRHDGALRFGKHSSTVRLHGVTDDLAGDSRYPAAGPAINIQQQHHICGGQRVTSPRAKCPCAGDARRLEHHDYAALGQRAGRLQICRDLRGVAGVAIDDRGAIYFTDTGKPARNSAVTG